MNALADIWNNLDWSVPAQLLLRVVPALLCITLHELSHGFTACLLGDTTARDAGRLTLPVNMYRFRDPKGGMALTALAGPVSNLVICVVFLFLYGVCYTPLYVTARLGDFGRTLMEMFYLTAYISLGMGLFNLLPVPPLDGSKVLFAVLPENAYEVLMRYERYGMIALMMLVWSGFLGSPLTTAVSWLFDRLFAVAVFGFRLTGGLR